MAPTFTWNETVNLAEASVWISSPEQGASVRTAFGIQGGAIIRLHHLRQEFDSGEWSSEEFDTFVNGTLKVRVGNREYTPWVGPGENGSIQWFVQVRDAAVGSTPISVELTASVSVGTSQGNGNAQSNMEEGPVERSASLTVTVDADAPVLRLSSSFSKSPPWEVVIEGTAEDPSSGIESVRWKSGWYSGDVEKISGNEMQWQWRVTVPLFDRSQEHLIQITATNGVGFKTVENIRVPADNEPPTINVEQPVESPHYFDWEGADTALEVSGTASDEQTDIVSVTWQLHGGEVDDAVVTSENETTKSWRFTALIPSPTQRNLYIKARDAAGNTSEVVRDLRPQA